MRDHKQFKALRQIFLPFLSLLFSFGCTTVPEAQKSVAPATPAQLTFQDEMVNRPGAERTPYVILVSIDGYRFDYNDKFHPPHLEQMAKSGVAAEGLVPVYPSKTFPNHYSIVTGLYADRHGIVSNDFYDPDRKTSFALSDRSAVEDGSWYLGEPLWNTIEKQGLMTASCFWVGSEAEIGGRHPNYYFRYDKTLPDSIRVDQVLGWLKLAPEKRPHFITLYFDEVDLAAHREGTKSAAVQAAVLRVDQAIGQLEVGIQQTGLPVDVIVVSDHGMEDLDSNKTILVDSIPGVTTLLTHFMTLGRGPQMTFYLKPGNDPGMIRELQTALLKTPQHFRALRRSQMKSLHYSKSARVGDLVLIPEPVYSLGLGGNSPVMKGGNHGWDPKEAPNMMGVFYAEGPDFKAGVRLAKFENIHVYPMVLSILGLKQTPGIDGKLSVTKKILKAKNQH